jgi:oligoendopeptidase F
MKFDPKRIATACALVFLQAAGGAAVAATAAAQAPAAAPAAAQRWDLRDLYPDPAAWQTAFDAAQQRIGKLEALKPTVAGGTAAMRDTLVEISDAQRAVYRLYVYASLLADEDLREPRAQERKQQALALYTLLNEKTAWLAPAVQALGAERVRAAITADAVLARRFDFQLEETLRALPHTLSPEGEALLAASINVLAQPSIVYEQLTDNELPRPTITLAGGRKLKLTSSAYEASRTSPNRADRKKVFDAFFGSFKAAEGTLGATLNAQVLANVYNAKSRRHASALGAALFSDTMPTAVYETLVAQANAGLPVLHRYLALRKKLLGIQGPLAYYDNYPPLVPPPKAARFDVEGSKALTLAALAPLGDEYLGLLKKGFAANWVDSHPRPGKASGAYVSGWAYDVHPYVLLNHNDDFESLSTLAHEWGHAVHSLLANAAQPFEKAGYSTFIAESASIANEMLLSDHLVAGAKTRAERLFYLSQALESIRTTFFRQVMFAEFENTIHKEVEAGRPLSGARLTELYCGLLKRYYGHEAGVMQIDPAYCTEWAYIPHFYRNHYVWQYATSMVGAAGFTEALQQPGAAGIAARDRFIALLKAGGSAPPYPLYQRAGIDMAQPAPYQALVRRMGKLLDDFEREWATKPRAGTR